MRRFNYTGRQKIRHSDVVIVLKPQEDRSIELDAAIVLPTDGLPAEAPVVVEAYHSTKYERVEHGTVGNPYPPGPVRLGLFDPEESFLFRVKVIGSGDAAGRILAMAHGIRPTLPQDLPRSSLLPVSIEPLGDLVYKVDFPGNDRPVLILNERLDSVHEQGIKALARSSMFNSLVYPSIVREILIRILIVEEYAGDDDEPEPWVAKWKRFARKFNPEPIPLLEAESDPEEILSWIDVVVNEVGARANALREFERAVEEQSCAR